VSWDTAPRLPPRDSRGTGRAGACSLELGTADAHKGLSVLGNPESLKSCAAVTAGSARQQPPRSSPLCPKRQRKPNSARCFGSAAHSCYAGTFQRWQQKGRSCPPRPGAVLQPGVPLQNRAAHAGCAASVKRCRPSTESTAFPLPWKAVGGGRTAPRRGAPQLRAFQLRILEATATPRSAGRALVLLTSSLREGSLADHNTLRRSPLTILSLS